MGQSIENSEGLRLTLFKPAAGSGPSLFDRKVGEPRTDYKPPHKSDGES
jgi:hypothetical protein